MRARWLVRTSSLSFQKHTAYVTQVHCWDIMRAAYAIGTNAHNSRYILPRKKKLVPRALLSCINTWEFLRTFEKCTSLVFLKFSRAYTTQQYTRRVFYLFNITLTLH